MYKKCFSRYFNGVPSLQIRSHILNILGKEKHIFRLFLVQSNEDIEFYLSQKQNNIHEDLYLCETRC